MRYKVWVLFSNGDRFVDTETKHHPDVKKALGRLCGGPAGRGGLINEVRVVDSLDMTCFLAQKVNGRMKMIHPPNTQTNGDLCHG